MEALNVCLDLSSDAKEQRWSRSWARSADRFANDYEAFAESLMGCSAAFTPEQLGRGRWREGEVP